MNSEEVTKRFLELGIDEEDLIEKFILGSGPGGQKINKTSSCVYLRHIPSGIEVKCQKGRSREENRLLARLELCDKIEFLEKKRLQAQNAARAKRRRQTRKKSAAQKEKMVQAKRHRSSKKTGRMAPRQNHHD